MGLRTARGTEGISIATVKKEKRLLNNQRPFESVVHHKLPTGCIDRGLERLQIREIRGRIFISPSSSSSTAEHIYMNVEVS